MKHRHNIRYYDDLTRERLIYYNGEYYKMREEFFAGTPFTVPRMIWDPYGPWRMARPVQHPMRYWTDLDYRHQHRVREAVTKFREHYMRDGYDAQIDGLMIAPLGATVQVKQIPIITISFGDPNFNYSVEIDSSKVYRIDYLADGKLSTVIGKLTDTRILPGTDYRGKDIYYVILTIDCSSDFGSDIRTIDSRDVRYICALSDLQTNVSVTNTYIGVDEPDGEEYGGWYNPINKEYHILQANEWKLLPEKPTDAPIGKYYAYDIEKAEWVLKDIPPMPSTYRRDQIWVFDEVHGYWTSANICPRPVQEIEYPELTRESIKVMYAEPCTLDGSQITNENEMYYNTYYKTWYIREVQPKSPNPEYLTYVFDHQHREWVGVHSNTKAVAEDQIAFYDFDVMDWLIVTDVKPDDVEYPEYYAWVFYPEIGEHLYMRKKLTYNIDENTWTLEPDEIFNRPKIECKEGYFWKYYSSYNKWFQTPISDVSRKLPMNINGEVANRDYEYPVYGSNNSALIIDYRPKTFF